jgi:hypothetical protein
MLQHIIPTKMTNRDVCFDRKEVVPDDRTLEKALEGAYPAYKEILTLIEGFLREWKFYGAKHGWQLKVSKKGKALFYLTPQGGIFKVGFAVREKEKELLLNSKLSAKAKAELAHTKKYPEGYPLMLHVKEARDMRSVRLVVETLKSLRP